MMTTLDTTRTRIQRGYNNNDNNVKDTTTRYDEYNNKDDTTPTNNRYQTKEMQWSSGVRLALILRV
jgi:hypothetical protein